MRISKGLKNFIQRTQEKLRKELEQHHIIYNKLKSDPNNSELEKRLKQIQSAINAIGEDQQFALHRIKLEVKEYEKGQQENGISHAIIGRATNLNNSIQSATSKLIKKSPSKSPTSPPPPSNEDTTRNAVDTPAASEESCDAPSLHSPEPPSNPAQLHDLTQSQFLKYFCLVTHQVHAEMQNKRVERKRRSTANPQFFYGTKWDHPKRKRNTYLLSSASPPQTRQAAKKAKAERSITPPSKPQSSGSVSPVESKDILIPKLPSGLTIERIDPNRSTPDAKLCIECRLPGDNLNVCEICSNGFHVSCHNRPLVQQPKKCPTCIIDLEVRTVGSLNVPSGISVSCTPSPTIDLTEKLHEKQKLLEENKSLTAELIKLQDQHTQLTMSLKERQSTKEELLVTRHMTEDKIKTLLSFINSIKSPITATLQ